MFDQHIISRTITLTLLTALTITIGVIALSPPASLYA
jgi:hypothetical protein